MTDPMNLTIAVVILATLLVIKRRWKPRLKSPTLDKWELNLKYLEYGKSPFRELSKVVRRK